jgi:2-polyprenyl-6-methoxyphenol hydroxylase-like FAD-dependent oxidoreductase
MDSDASVLEELSVIIIGGGIGGLTLALALRAVGIAAMIYERASNLERAGFGSGFFLWANAMAALRQIGCADEVARVAAPIARFEQYDWRGKHLATWPVAEMSQPAGVPSVCVSRADLYQELLSAIGPEVLQLGAECTGFTQDDHGVTAHFADGRSTRGDLLIGADGARSTVRQALQSKRRAPYAGYTAWHAIIEDSYQEYLGDAFRQIWGQGARFVHYPVGRGRRYWAAFLAVPSDYALPAGVQESLRQRYHDWMAPIPDLIAATQDADLHRTPIVASLPLRHWGEGRVTLLGDAAHPMTPNLGQGACQAIEDAVSLAKCLRGVTSRSDLPAILRDYEARRRRRTNSIVLRAWAIGRTGLWKNGVACMLRDQVRRVAFNTVALWQQRKDLAHVV